MRRSSARPRSATALRCRTLRPRMAAFALLVRVAGSPSISSDGGPDANGSRHTRLTGAGSHPSSARQLRGHDQRRNVATFVELPFFARLEALNRRIPMPPQCQIDPLQHDVVDFEALLERDLA